MKHRKGYSGIYRITNIVNGKIYIGSSVNLMKRQSRHSLNLRKGIHENRYLQRSFNLYGEESFVIDILEYCKKESLIEREQFWLDAYKAQGLMLYNICLIAKSRFGVKLSEETKSKMALSHQGKHHLLKETREKLSKMRMGELNPFFNKKHNEKTKEIISKTHKGKKFSKEHRDKISQANRERLISEITIKKLRDKMMGRFKGELNPFYGEKHSDETKRKMSEAAKLRFTNAA